MQSHSPEELFIRAQGGDAVALGQLLEGYRSQLRQTAQAQLDSQIRVRADASDIVQGTFLEAQRDFGQFRGESVAQLLAWLQKILKHNISNTIQQHVYAQKRSIHREGSLDDSQQQHPAADLSTPSSRVIRSEFVEKLTEAIDGLPQDQREAIRLRHIEGLSVTDIATHFDRSVVAVAGLIKRGLRNLRGEFADEIKDDQR